MSEHPDARPTATILVVDDEQDIREAVRRMLAQAGYTVLVGAGPADALRVCRERAGEIDLLFTDVLMPEMSGQELAGHIRELRPGVRILYVSGYPKPMALQQGLVRGDVAMLEKPFTRDRLLEAVAEALVQAHQRG